MLNKYSGSRRYEAGDTVLDGGSTYRARRAVNPGERPQSAPDAWELVDASPMSETLRNPMTPEPR